MHAPSRRAAPPSVDGSGVTDDVLSRLRAEHEPPPALSYGTVRDYCESRDLFGAWARRAHDLKDQQRPWMLKAALALTRPGDRVLEIGAGEPSTAHMLARAGCQVTVVDPYEGAANGPADAEAMRRAFPDVRLLRDRFGPETRGLDPQGYDLFYSISVLEHLPAAELSAVFAAMRTHARAGGRQVHTIDHVHAGPGAEHHRTMLGRVCAEMGIEAPDLDAMLARADGDAETCWLSAEAHHGWRAGRSYEDFPMRRCMAVQVSGSVRPG